MESKVQKLVVEKAEIKAAYNELATKPRALSYAQAASKELKAVQDGRSRVTPKPSEVIILKPGDENDQRSNDEIRTDVTRALKTKRKEIKIRNIRQLRDKGVLIEVNDKEDVKKVKETDFSLINLNVKVPKKSDPSIIVYDVERDWKAEELKEEFLAKDFIGVPETDMQRLAKKVSFKHSYKTKNAGRVNWIVQLPARLFEEILREGRAYMLWRSYRVKEYLDIARCYKCHMYGHVAKFCKVEKQVCETCGGSDHEKANCDKKDNPVCPNCVRKRRRDTRHSVRDKNCPEYQRQVIFYNSKIKWASG